MSISKEACIEKITSNVTEATKIHGRVLELLNLSSMSVNQLRSVEYLTDILRVEQRTIDDLAMLNKEIT